VKINIWERVLILTLLTLASTSAIQAFPGLGKLMGSPDASTKPPSPHMAQISGGDLIYRFIGLGGINVSMPHAPGNYVKANDIYEIYIDGTGVGSSAAFKPESVASDFTATASSAYFVSATANCLLPSAQDFAGKEVLVCNKSATATIAYSTTAGQTISGQASGTLTNANQYQTDRFVSDGTNWYKE
jgi:hypothetical protein